MAVDTTVATTRRSRDGGVDCSSRRRRHRIAFEQRLSHAQFLDALLGIMSKVLPVVKQMLPTVEQLVPAIGGLLKGGTAARRRAHRLRGGRGTTTAGAKPDLGDAARPAAAADHPGDGHSRSYRSRAVTPPDVTPPAAKQQSRSFAQSAPQRYSYASWAPLLAALPALSGAAAEGADARDGAGADRGRRSEQADEDGVRRARSTPPRSARRRPTSCTRTCGRSTPASATTCSSRCWRRCRCLTTSGDVRHKLSRRVQPRHRRPRPGRPRRLPPGRLPPRRGDHPAGHRRHRPPDPPAHAAGPGQGRRHARHSGDPGMAVRPSRGRAASRSRPCCRRR